MYLGSATKVLFRTEAATRSPEVRLPPKEAGRARSLEMRQSDIPRLLFQLAASPRVYVRSRDPFLRQPTRMLLARGCCPLLIAGPEKQAAVAARTQIWLPK